MYVAVKGGEAAIDNAHQLLSEKRRGNAIVAELSVKQIQEQLSLAVDRVMTEGSLYDAELAALAIKQAAGDLIEAIFLLRAYRTTLPRFAYTTPIDTNSMRVERRISATYKDIPGGQALGPTFDYTHRLLDFKLLAEGQAASNEGDQIDASEQPYNEEQPYSEEHYSRVSDFLRQDEMLYENHHMPEQACDLTREPLMYPCDRSARLQSLVRSDEGFLLAMGYSTQRGYGRTHPFAGEIRMGHVEVSLHVEELGFDVVIGEICVTECDMINQFTGNNEQPPQFTRGYGISFGFCERKTMAMALVDRSLQAKELAEPTDTPAAQEEFVLSHCDNVESSGFVSHLKLPHYVDFQSELALVRQLREEWLNEKSKREQQDDNEQGSSSEVNNG
jgi:alpha-D-ribose 1-methylphosphonate 5-triphosphate synthase subunit PhnI